MKIIPRADYRAMPWKNGGGITYEIATGPAGAGLEDFLWRFSMAEVASDGPFSAFPGIDRTLTLIEGEGVTLTLDGLPILLETDSQPLVFKGETAVTSTLVAGPVLDLNVMTRRAKARHAVRRVSGAVSGPVKGKGDVVALFALESGRIDNAEVGCFDLALLSGPVTLQGQALLIEIDFVAG